MYGMSRIAVKRSILRHNTGFVLTPFHLIDIDDSVNLKKANQIVINDSSN